MSQPAADHRREAYRAHARRCVTLASMADSPAVADAYREVAVSYELLAQWATGPSRVLVLAQLRDFWDSLAAVPESPLSKTEQGGAEPSC
jgi:hypothetical protein